jgi:phage shock protein C
MSRLTRLPRGHGGMIGGVSAGLSQGFGLPVTVIRALFVIFALTGVGEVVYLVLWILMPKSRGYGY